MSETIPAADQAATILPPPTITEVRIGIARTINLGNFESLRIEGSLTATLTDGDDIEAVRSGLQIQLRTLIEETYRAQHKTKAPTAPRREADPTPGSFKPATPEPEY